MSFSFPDLIVESVLRDGFAVLKRNPDLIDKIFASLTSDFLNTKYGDKELQRIKDQIIKKDWSFVHSFGMVEANLPCVSIQLGSENEAKEIAHLEDFEGEVTEDITDPDQLNALIVVQNILPDSYDYQSGAILVPDAIDLSSIYINLVYVDAVGNEFFITGGINNTPGQKQFMVEAGSEVDISDVGYIKSSIDYIQYANRGVHSDVNLLLGVHTKDALLTKYFYSLVKYFLIARKKSLIERNFICSSYQGSDFTRNLKYEADIVYTRFLTLTGKVQDQFSSELDAAFDNIDVRITVPRATATNDELGRQDQTIQVQDNDPTGGA
jgi:hypothetical protein